MLACFAFSMYVTSSLGHPEGRWNVVVLLTIVLAGAGVVILSCFSWINEDKSVPINALEPVTSIVSDSDLHRIRIFSFLNSLKSSYSSEHSSDKTLVCALFKVNSNLYNFFSIWFNSITLGSDWQEF